MSTIALNKTTENVKAKTQLRMLNLINNKRIKEVINVLKNGKSITVTKIWWQISKETVTDMDYSNVNQSLLAMKDYDLVTTCRKGKNVSYSLNFEKFERIVNAINKFNAA